MLETLKMVLDVAQIGLNIALIVIILKWKKELNEEEE